jgi:branched-chain amino acid transport system substrate-binding protein
MFAVLRALALGAVVLATVDLSAAQSTASAQQGPSAIEVQIGALLPLTGDLARLGQEENAALALAVTDINDYLAAVGSTSRVTVSVEDTASDPALALDKLHILANRGIQIVIGPSTSAELERVKSFADETGILLLSGSSTAPSLALPGDNLFRLVPDDTHQAEAVSQLMWQERVRAVIPIWRGDVWGDDLSTEITRRFDRLGGRVLDGVRYNPGTQNFSAELAALAARVEQTSAAYGTESVAVALIGFDNDAVSVASQASAYPALATVRWYGSDVIAHSQLLMRNAEAARFAAMVRLRNPLFAEGAERYRSIRSRIEERLGVTPNVYALTTYDAGWLAAYTYLTTGRTKDIAALKVALQQTAESYYGATGWLGLNAAGDRRSANYDFWAITEQNGSFQWQVSARYEIDHRTSEGRVVSEIAFPAKEIRIVTGWLGGSEQFVQAIAAEAERMLNVPVVVVTNVGNNGLDAVREVQAAPKDGYTVLLGIDFDLSLFAQGQREQDPVEDFVPLLIGNLAVTQIYVRPDDPRYSTWDELIAYAREHPGLKVATIGTPLDLEGLALAGLERTFEVDFESVPYERSPERNASLLSGETDLLIDQSGDVKEFLDTGKYRPVLTLWNERVRGFEGVPTAREMGADIESLLRIRWLAVADGTPPQRVELLRSTFLAAFNSAGYQRYLNENMLDLVPYPVDTTRALQEELDRYRRLYESLAPATAGLRQRR